MDGTKLELVIADTQNDFCGPNRQLFVPGVDEVMEMVGRWMKTCGANQFGRNL